MGYRDYYSFTLEQFMEDERNYSEERHVLRKAKKRRRMIAGLYIREYRKVLIKPDSVCKHCGTTEKLTLDHIIPVSKEGGNSVENLQILCLTCNIKKGNKI